MGLSFHWRSGSLMRALNRRSCSLFPTSSQYLMRMIPASTTYFSNVGASSKNRRYCSSVQNPMTCSTPALLVPTTVEDHDFARGRKMKHISLHIHLGFFAVVTGR